MAEETGVTAADSPSAEAIQEASPSPQDVKPEGAAGASDQRPLENWQAEFRRKSDRTQQQLDTVLQWIASQGHLSQRPAASPTATGQPSNEDLWALAQQGDRVAFEEYQRRIARQEVLQNSAVQGRYAMVEAQMAAIMSKYPVLRDVSHPLTQTANAAYHLLVTQAGYPADRSTLLEAAKIAIADRPDLVAEMHSQGNQAREQGRISATQRAQTGQTGTSVRQASAHADATPKVNAAQAELAKRMGVKDPAGARTRFLKRQEEGTSSLGAVASFVKEEDL